MTFKQVSLLNVFIFLVLVTRSGVRCNTWQEVKEWAIYCTD